jgi:DNA-binding PadR family transcriptional regulator
MLSKDGFGGTFHFLAKGDFPGLLLVVLQEKPMHGYEIMKALEERFHGLYKPSAGAIYPALSSLHRRGLVTVAGGERRKTYQITPQGKAYLRGVRNEVKSRFATLQKTLGPERAAMFREFRTTGRLIATNMRNVTPEQATELRAVMVEMRERILKILAE